MKPKIVMLSLSKGLLSFLVLGLLNLEEVSQVKRMEKGKKIFTVQAAVILKLLRSFFLHVEFVLIYEISKVV